MTYPYYNRGYGYGGYGNTWRHKDWGYLTRRRRYRPYRRKSVFDDPYWFYYNHPGARYRRAARYYGVQPRYYTHNWWW